MLNINKGRNKSLMSACRTLKDYAEYTFRVRRYAKEMPLEDAVERAIMECIREGILSDFLSKNRAEVKKVSIYEYDEEKHMRQTRQEGWEDGAFSMRLEDIKNVMETMKLPALKAMEILKIPEGEQEKYLDQLKGEPPV